MSSPMGTRCAVLSGSIMGLRRIFASVTLDGTCIKRYVDTYALADATDDLAADTDQAPRRSLEEAPADGSRAASRVGLDPSGDSGNHGALSVAGAGDRIVPRRGDASACRPDREHDSRASHRPLPQGACPRVSGSGARMSGG